MFSLGISFFVGKLLKTSYPTILTDLKKMERLPSLLVLMKSFFFFFWYYFKKMEYIVFILKISNLRNLFCPGFLLKIALLSTSQKLQRI
jgi:hypothetical protein